VLNADIFPDHKVLDSSVSCDELFEDFEEFGLRDFGVVVLVDGLDELVDLLRLHLSVPAETLEGVVDEVVDLIALKGARLVSVVLCEDSVDGLSQLVVCWLSTHQK
jgi:hypothetical protein